MHLKILNNNKREKESHEEWNPFCKLSIVKYLLHK